MMKKRNRKVGVLALLLAVFFTPSRPAFSQTPPSELTLEFIEIRKAASRARVAVLDFSPLSPEAGGQAAFMTEHLRDTLSLTGLFELIPPAAYPQLSLDRSGPDFPAWKLIAAEFLIQGNIAAAGKDRWQVEMRCFDVLESDLELGKRYVGNTVHLNRMALRFVDELLDRLTGRRGALDAKIAYVSDITGRKEIRIMDTDGRNDLALTTNHTLNLGPFWAPDGVRLLYLGYKGRNPDLYLADLEKGEEKRFFRGPGLSLPGRFSPDGRTIAFAREDAQGNIDLYLIGIDGRNLRRITSSPANDLSPAWDPEGRLIAFVSDRLGNPQIFLLDISRGPESAWNRPVLLTREGNYNTSPAWSPDGRYIAFTGRSSGQFDLFLLDMAGGRKLLRRLTATPFNEEDPAWSPDSRFLVYSSNKHGSYDIFLMSIYGGTPRRLTETRAKEIMPAWSPPLKR